MAPPIANATIERWPTPTAYDRTAALSPTEQAAIARVLAEWAPGERYGRWPPPIQEALERLLRPIRDTVALTEPRCRSRSWVIRLLLRQMHRRQLAFWGWEAADWLEVLQETNVRHHVMVCAYLLGGFSDLHQRCPSFFREAFARKVFGAAAVDEAVARVREQVARWGYEGSLIFSRLPRALGELLLLSRSPRLEDITPAVVAAARGACPAPSLHAELALMERALVAMGILPHPAADPRAAPAASPTEWEDWCARWRATSTRAPITRRTVFYAIERAGRWLRAVHPEVVSPAQWTGELAAEYVAAVDRMRVGDYARTSLPPPHAQNIGKPLGPAAKAHLISALAVFMRDCQEWGWVTLRFDLRRMLATPRAIKALIGPNPRVIADDVWAKLLWAGLNLEAADVPLRRNSGRPWYPLELLRALVTTWLFAGLRRDELLRLRVGCIRWQPVATAAPGTEDVRPADSICWLDVPVNKTGTAFTKAVDRLVGEAVSTWERVRPVQPAKLDPKTGEMVHYLFAYRCQRVGGNYLNDVLIPGLCRKAGVPRQDARGNITSHRARSTIASQLFNAKEPLSLFELQEWLGHHSPEATQHYAKITPTKLAKSYAAAGYFERNLRMIDVLIDKEAITSGAAAQGEPWRFYDLAHGYCTYDFFDQCPHRLACAKCAFYVPKGSSRAQMLEGKTNLQRLLQEIPLTEDEEAAVRDGVAAYEKLLAQLVDIPTPAGPTPRQLGQRETIPLRMVARPVAHDWQGAGSRGRPDST